MADGMALWKITMLRGTTPLVVTLSRNPMRLVVVETGKTGLKLGTYPTGSMKRLQTSEATERNCLLAKPYSSS